MTELDGFGRYHAVFVEITKAEHSHGGPGWEFGTCLWSPSRNRTGADRYSLMREPSKGDLVLHFLHDRWPDGEESKLAGKSVVREPYRVVTAPPPSPGSWSGFESYYRIDLQGYHPFSSPVSLRTLVEEYGDDIRRELAGSKPRYYPFNTHGDSIRTVQGIYLAACTQHLFETLRSALGIQGASTPTDAAERQRSYAEGRRLSRERFFFARNPNLVTAAKTHYGPSCMVCGFDFEQQYGELGRGFIEVHHLNPLSERDVSEWTEQSTTDVTQVAVLCANCHRMVHRRRPALGLEELRMEHKVRSP